MRRLLSAALALLVVLALQTRPAVAQSIWTGPPSPNSHLALEWLKPVLDERDAVSFFTSSFVLSGRAVLSDRLRLVGEIPVSHVRLDADLARSSSMSASTEVGNPYLGVEIYGSDPSVFVETGLRLPALNSEDLVPASFGAVSDLNRLGAYVVDQVPLQVLLNYHWTPSASNFALRLRGGPELFVPVADGQGGNMILTYGAQGWYTGARVRVGVGATGRLNVTQEQAAFGERTLHHVGATVQGLFASVRPGLLIRVPADAELSDVLDAVIGITVTVPLP
jgi:hypothetical protein